MQSLQEVLEHHDRLWQRLETHIEIALAECPDGDAKQEKDAPPNIKKLIETATLLKHIQNGRCAARKELAKQETTKSDEDESGGVDDEKINRILRIMQEDEEEEGSAEGDM